mgnify:CR=1 FL=1
MTENDLTAKIFEARFLTSRDGRFKSISVTLVASPHDERSSYWGFAAKVTEIDLKRPSLEVRKRASRALAVRSFSVTLVWSPYCKPP